MSIWLQILKLAAAGDSAEAKRLLAELPFVLRYPEVVPGVGTKYRGPLAIAVQAFISKLPKVDRGMAESRFEDFVDYVADLIQMSVHRTLLLIEFCLAHPNQSLEEMGDSFTGWDGIKRGARDRQNWISRHLTSMVAAGVALPPAVAEKGQYREGTDADLYGYSEIALSKGWDLAFSWRDFKSREEIDAAYLCVGDESESDSGVGNEKADYGSITTAQVVLALSTPSDSDFLVDLDEMGKNLSASLVDLLKRFDADKPSEGYSPIAWHCVWWFLIDEYQSLPLELEVREPECGVDRELADHIQRTYPDVSNPSRRTISRRRAKFESECVNQARSVLLEWAQEKMWVGIDE